MGSEDQDTSIKWERKISKVYNAKSLKEGNCYEKRVMFLWGCVVLVLVIVVILFCLARKESEELPDKDKLNVSAHVAIESLDITESYIKIKFSNTSQSKYYLEAMWIERYEDGIWKEISYTKPSDLYIYRIAPDSVWNERGWNEDDRANVLDEKGDTWEIKTLQEDCTSLEKGRYRIGYVVTDRENEPEVISKEFQLN